MIILFLLGNFKNYFATFSRKKVGASLQKLATYVRLGLKTKK